MHALQCRDRRLLPHPAYNEAATIGEVLQRIRALDLDAEIIVVDDGSTDETAAIVEA